MDMWLDLSKLHNRQNYNIFEGLFAIDYIVV